MLNHSVIQQQNVNAVAPYNLIDVVIMLCYSFVGIGIGVIVGVSGTFLLAIIIVVVVVIVCKVAKTHQKTCKFLQVIHA